MWLVVAVIVVVSTVNYMVYDPTRPGSPSSILPDAPRPAPELADDRKVEEQDCSKPVDLSSGNLRCK